MIHYTKATVFNTPSQAIVNTVNCVGVMGAGLALEFKLRYPQMYEDYRQKCQNEQIKTGSLSTYKTEDDLLIINFPTKFNWRYPSKIQWLEEGLKYFVQHYQSWYIKSVAFPKLGCEHGGLNWENVKVLMETYLANLQDLDVYICLDSQLKPQGAEKIMLELLNHTNLWIDGLKIKSNISKKIIVNLPKIKRFRHLQKTSGIGKETYQKLFQFLYSLATQKKDKLEETKVNNPRVLEQQCLLSLVSENNKQTDILTNNQLKSDPKNKKTSLVEIQDKVKKNANKENNQEIKINNKSVSEINAQFSVHNNSKSSSENNSKAKNKNVKLQIPKSNLLTKNQSSNNEDLRIKLALILSELNIQVEEMRTLTWNSLIKINDRYLIELDKGKIINLPVNIWHKLEEIKILQNVTNNSELIISSRKKSKLTHKNQPLTVGTIKKLISQGIKKETQLQQLQLSFEN